MRGSVCLHTFDKYDQNSTLTNITNALRSFLYSVGELLIFDSYFFNMDISVNIAYKAFKFRRREACLKILI